MNCKKCGEEWPLTKTKKEKEKCVCGNTLKNNQKEEIKVGTNAYVCGVDGLFERMVVYKIKKHSYLMGNGRTIRTLEIGKIGADDEKMIPEKLKQPRLFFSGKSAAISVSKSSNLTAISFFETEENEVEMSSVVKEYIVGDFSSMEINGNKAVYYCKKHSNNHLDVILSCTRLEIYNTKMISQESTLGNPFDKINVEEAIKYGLHIEMSNDGDWIYVNVIEEFNSKEYTADNSLADFLEKCTDLI